MKKIFMYAMLFAACSMGMVSCSSDDDNNNDNGFAENDKNHQARLRVSPRKKILIREGGRKKGRWVILNKQSN